MKEKLKQFWEKLNPKQKRKAVIGAVIALLVSLVILASSEEPATPNGAVHTKVRSISLKDDVLKKSIFAATNEKLEKERKKNEKQLAAAHQDVAELKQELGALKADLTKGKYGQTGNLGSTSNLAYPPPPGRSNSNNPVRYTATAPPVPTAPRPIQVKVKDLASQKPRGAIGSVEAPAPPPKPKKPAKAANNYLPISIIKATTLTGIHATVSEAGMSNPQPVILRISKPAILPNRIRKNLKGCFVIAEGYGSLATERVELRTKTISCLSNQGRATIEEPIKGFVVDADGQLGLAGKVVAKFGSVLARTALSGFFEGVGELTAESSQASSISPGTGVVTKQAISSKNIAKGSLGKGLQKATSEIGKFYLNLAKQSLPVVEILPGKKVEIVLTEGVQLHVNYNNGSP